MDPKIKKWVHVLDDLYKKLFEREKKLELCIELVGYLIENYPNKKSTKDYHEQILHDLNSFLVSCRIPHKKSSDAILGELDDFFSERKREEELNKFLHGFEGEILPFFLLWPKKPPSLKTPIFLRKKIQYLEDYYKNCIALLAKKFLNQPAVFHAVVFTIHELLEHQKKLLETSIQPVVDDLLHEKLSPFMEHGPQHSRTRLIPYDVGDANRALFAQNNLDYLVMDDDYDEYYSNLLASRPLIYGWNTHNFLRKKEMNIYRDEPIGPLDEPATNQPEILVQVSFLSVIDLSTSSEVVFFEDFFPKDFFSIKQKNEGGENITFDSSLFLIHVLNSRITDELKCSIQVMWPEEERVVESRSNSISSFIRMNKEEVEDAESYTDIYFNFAFSFSNPKEKIKFFNSANQSMIFSINKKNVTAFAVNNLVSMKAISSVFKLYKEKFNADLTTVLKRLHFSRFIDYEMRKIDFGGCCNLVLKWLYGDDENWVASSLEVEDFGVRAPEPIINLVKDNVETFYMILYRSLPYNVFKKDVVQELRKVNFPKSFIQKILHSNGYEKCLDFLEKRFEFRIDF